MHWAINITKAIDEPEDITLENIQTLIDNITDEIMKKIDSVKNLSGYKITKKKSLRSNKSKKRRLI